MKRSVIVFTLLASVLWYWIGLSVVAVFSPGALYPTTYFRGIPLLHAFIAGTPFAALVGLCPAIAAGALISAWTKNAGRLIILKVLTVASGISLDVTMIAFLPLSSDPDRGVLPLLGFIFLCVFAAIAMSWLIVQGMRPSTGPGLQVGTLNKS
jgi:hypothetical protein